MWSAWHPSYILVSVLLNSNRIRRVGYERLLLGQQLLQNGSESSVIGQVVVLLLGHMTFTHLNDQQYPEQHVAE